MIAAPTGPTRPPSASIGGALQLATASTTSRSALNAFSRSSDTTSTCSGRVSSLYNLPQYVYFALDIFFVQFSFSYILRARKGQADLKLKNESRTLTWPPTARPQATSFASWSDTKESNSRTDVLLTAPLAPPAAGMIGAAGAEAACPVAALPWGYHAVQMPQFRYEI